MFIFCNIRNCAFFQHRAIIHFARFSRYEATISLNINRLVFRKAKCCVLGVVGTEVLNVKVRLPSLDHGNRRTTRVISNIVDSTGKLRFKGAAPTDVLSCLAFMRVRKSAKRDY
jgi:hypothetical protein